MMRHVRAGLVLAASLALLASGVAQAGTPNGQGLYPHTTDQCTPSVGSTDMLLTGGRSLWIGDGHYVIYSYTQNGVPGGTLGTMSGLVDRGTVTCSGTVEGAAITSVDYLIK